MFIYYIIIIYNKQRYDVYNLCKYKDIFINIYKKKTCSVLNSKVQYHQYFNVF